LVSGCKWCLQSASHNSSMFMLFTSIIASVLLRIVGTDGKLQLGSLDTRIPAANVSTPALGNLTVVDPRMRKHLEFKRTSAQRAARGLTLSICVAKYAWVVESHCDCNSGCVCLAGTPRVRDVAQPGSALAWGARNATATESQSPPTITTAYSRHSQSSAAPVDTLVDTFLSAWMRRWSIST
jgi:hypothetical protein